MHHNRRAADDYRRVSLRYASFSAPGYSSEGQLSGGPADDGSIWIYAPSDKAAGQLTEAFVAGHSELEFKRQDAADVSTYKIPERPPGVITDAYSACVQNMLGFGKQT